MRWTMIYILKKRKLIKPVIPILIFLCSINHVLGQQTSDPSGPLQDYELRKFDQDLLERYRADEDYQYKVYQQAPKGPFRRFMDSLKEWYYGLIQSTATRNVLKILFYICCFVALIFFIIKLLGLEANSVFRKKEASKDPFTIHEEQLDEIDFEQALQKAFQAGQWRLFIRLSYLYSLKAFADAGKLIVKRGKTNHDYLYELPEQGLKNDFSGLGHLFEYTWYGHFEADQEMAKKAEAYLKNISTELGGRS